MGTKEKLVERFSSMPKDFEWRELQRLLAHFGYDELPSGKGAKFICRRTQAVIFLHPPHPGNVVKRVYLKQVKGHLKERGFL